MTAHCGTCAFWGDPSDANESAKRYRRCMSVGQSGRWDDAPPTTDMYGSPLSPVVTDRAFVVDGSYYFAALKCREDFGCVAHHPREEAP